MDQSWLEYFACPDCRHSLEVSRVTTGNRSIHDGELRCVGCGSTFAVEDGIVRFCRTASADTADEVRKNTEMQRRDAGAENYEAYFSSFATAVEAESVVAALEPTPEDVVIELGVGTGRMASVYAGRVKAFIGVDLSLESLKRTYRRLEAVGATFCLAQADVCRLPFKANLFDKAVSPEVFEHLPSAESRNHGLAEACRVLRPNGKFIVTVYHYSLLKRLRNVVQPGRSPKEDSGLDYSFSFTRSEFSEWLSRYFEAHSVIAIRSAVLERLPVLGRFGLFAERVIQRTPLSFATGHLLQGIARKTRAIPNDVLCVDSDTAACVL